MDMKPTTTILLPLSAALFAVAVTSAHGSAPGEATHTPVLEMPARVPADPAAEAETLIETFGFIVGIQSNVSSFQFDQKEMRFFLKGFQRANDGEAIPSDLQTLLPRLETFLNQRQQDLAGIQARENQAKADAYFASLDQREEIAKTESGLRYQITREGRGDQPEPTDTVQIHYEGKLIDGTVFDSSRTAGEPVEFSLAGVIPGISEGVGKIREGGTIVLHIPPELAYGNERQPGIPPGSALVFDVELIRVTEGDPQIPPVQMLPQP